VYLAYELLPLPSAGKSSLSGAMTLSDTNLLGGSWGR
jgi:hypothetical protein